MQHSNHPTAALSTQEREQHQGGQATSSTGGGHEHDHHHAAHTDHTGHSAAMFQRPFWISLVLTIPILIYAELFQSVLHYHAPSFPGSFWLVPILASIVYWYGG